VAAGAGERLRLPHSTHAGHHLFAKLLVSPVLEHLKVHQQWDPFLFEPQSAPPSVAEKSLPMW
jgi:hypothetical protein